MMKGVSDALATGHHRITSLHTPLVTPCTLLLQAAVLPVPGADVSTRRCATIYSNR